MTRSLDEDIPLEQIDELPECKWSESVALDPRHRPQTLDKPSTTVRREWLRWPQEAHLLDEDNNRYRRLSLAEIAMIAGFSVDWVNVHGVSEKYQIAGLGDAVPPQVACVIFKTIDEIWQWKNRTSIEICAGVGGLASGAAAIGLRHIALIENWRPACKILRHKKPWAPDVVFCEDVKSFDFAQYDNKVGVLSGGPPCQPWSHAGQGRGQLDPRDLLGYLPQIIAQCRPEIFVVENVPGLVTNKEHSAYFEDLIQQLAAPGPAKLTYGISKGILNAADFGVPQKRQRLFILGFRGKSFTFASGVFNLITRKKTHCSPAKPIQGKSPWITLGEAFEDLLDPGGWRKFIKPSPKEDKPTTSKLETVCPLVIDDVKPSRSSKISLEWPTKEDVPVVLDDLWTTVPASKELQLHPLLFLRGFPKDKSLPQPSVAVIGNELKALQNLKRLYGGMVSLAYFDAPPVDVLKTDREGFRNSIWMTITQEFAQATRPLLSLNGVFILHVDDTSYHYGRMVLEEVFGSGNYVCTIVWQKKYGPQNDRDVPTDAQDYLIVFANEISKLPVIGLPVTDELIDDGDPRGPWRAAHKGARSGIEESKFEVNTPPYRWELIEGRLPPGLWRINPQLGAIWGKPTEAGTYKFKVKVSDSAGQETTSQLSICVLKTGEANLETSVWWLQKPIRSGGTLRIATKRMPDAVVNQEYWAVLAAQGGKPYKMKRRKPGPGRYWEFSLENLTENILRDNVQFGKKGTSLPAIKKHYSRLGEKRIVRQITWWSWKVAGKSEDASKHLKELANRGLVQEAPRIAKPEKLMKRLILLFAQQEKDFVLTLGDSTGSMASSTIKLNRNFIHLSGQTKQQLKLWERCAMPRLGAVIMKKDDLGITNDRDVVSIGDDKIDGFDILQVGKPLVTAQPDLEVYKVETEAYPLQSDRFLEAICSVGGFRRVQGQAVDGIDFKGNACIVVPPGSCLTELTLSKYVTEVAPNHKRLVIFFESSVLPDSVTTATTVFLKHLPFDLFS